MYKMMCPNIKYFQTNCKEQVKILVNRSWHGPSYAVGWLGQNEAEWTGKSEVTKAKFLAAGEVRTAIHNFPLAKSVSSNCIIPKQSTHATTYIIVVVVSYGDIQRSRANSLHSHVILHERLAFYSSYFNIHQSGVLTVLTWLVPHQTAAVSVRSVYTIQMCISVSMSSIFRWWLTLLM